MVSKLDWGIGGEIRFLVEAGSLKLTQEWRNKGCYSWKSARFQIHELCFVFVSGMTDPELK